MGLRPGRPTPIHAAEIIRFPEFVEKTREQLGNRVGPGRGIRSEIGGFAHFFQQAGGLRAVQIAQFRDILPHHLAMGAGEFLDHGLVAGGGNPIGADIGFRLEFLASSDQGSDFGLRHGYSSQVSGEVDSKIPTGRIAKSRGKKSANQRMLARHNFTPCP